MTLLPLLSQTIQNIDDQVTEIIQADRIWSRRAIFAINASILKALVSALSEMVKKDQKFGDKSRALIGPLREFCNGAAGEDDGWQLRRLQTLLLLALQGNTTSLSAAVKCSLEIEYAFFTAFITPPKKDPPVADVQVTNPEDLLKSSLEIVDELVRQHVRFIQLSAVLSFKQCPFPQSLLLDLLPAPMTAMQRLVLNLTGILLSPSQTIRSDLNETLEKYQTLQMTLDANLRQLELLPAAINELPPEILQLIFMMCVPPAHSTRSMARSEAPLLLERICMTWRQLVRATPMLWSVIDIRMPSVVTLYDRRKAGLKHFLAHSGSAPLSIAIWGEAPLLEFTLLFEVLVPHLHRCIYFQLQGKLGHLKLLNSEDFSCLKSFMFHNTTSAPPVFQAYDLEDFPTPDTWKEALTFLPPRLECLSLLFNNGTLALPDQINWTNLTELNLMAQLSNSKSPPATPVQKLLRILSKCTALTHCTISYPTESNPLEDMKCPMITLPQLSSLALVSIDTSTHRYAGGSTLGARPVRMTQLLNFLILPKLEELKISCGTCSWRRDDLSALMFLLHRSASSKLRKLILHQCQFTIPQLIKCLRLAPSIEELNASARYEPSGLPQYVFDFENVITALVNEPDTLCPNLERLRLENCLIKPTPALSRLVQSRSRARTLKKADIVFACPVKDLVDTRKEMLDDDEQTPTGFELSLRCSFHLNPWPAQDDDEDGCDSGVVVGY